MDQAKIGKFIKAMRKEKALTQSQVAELLGISDKTVSKWETGCGMPDLALMQPLCKLLGISLNELFSGQRLDEKAYYMEVEKNITKLKDEAKDLLVSECLQKIVLRNFEQKDGDLEVLQKFYCPFLSREATFDMVGEWNTLNYDGKYFEMFAVVCDGKVVGTLSLFEHSESVVSIGTEIFSQFRGMDYGTMATRRAIELCKQKGYKIICRQVREDNIAGKKLHASLGFETDNYVLYK